MQKVICDKCKREFVGNEMCHVQRVLLPYKKKKNEWIFSHFDLCDDCRHEVEEIRKAAEVRFMRGAL